LATNLRAGATKSSTSWALVASLLFDWHATVKGNRVH
jgi:hypothetical protein